MSCPVICTRDYNICASQTTFPGTKVNVSCDDLLLCFGVVFHAEHVYLKCLSVLASIAEHNCLCLKE